MKIKALLPIPRKGQIIINVDVRLSFYDIFKAELVENDINVAEYELVDSYGRQYSYVLPLEQQSCYPGMFLELKKIPEADDSVRLLKPVVQVSEQIRVRFNLVEIGYESFEIMCSRGSIVRDILKKYIETDDLEEYEIKFGDERFAVGMTISGIGVNTNDILRVCSISDSEEERSEADEEEDNLLNTIVSEEKDDSEALTIEEYEGMEREKQEWQVDHGMGHPLPPEVRRALYEHRAKNKGIMRFKLIESEFGRETLTILHLSPLETVADLYEQIISRFVSLMAKNSVTEEIIADFATKLKLFRLNGVEAIEPSEIELFEAFEEGDAEIDLRWEGGNIGQLVGV